MRMKRFLSTVVACVLTVSCSCISAGAVAPTQWEAVATSLRATNQFDIDVPANSARRANTSFSMEAGETITINAVYSPDDASVDIGIIAPDGLFYSVNSTDGSINQTFEVDERGSYTLAVRNNSDSSITITGFVRY